MKICFLYSNHYLAHMTAQPGIAYKLAVAARDDGHDVCIISNTASEVSLRPVGIKLVLFPGFGEMGTYIRQVHRLVQTIRQFDSDVLHVHGNLFYIFILLLWPFFRRPVAVYVGETLIIHSLSIRKILTFCLLFARHILVSSDFIRKELVAAGVPADKITTVRLGLAPQFLEAKQRKQKKIDVLYFGDNSTSRGFDLVVEAAQRLPAFRFEALLRYRQGQIPAVKNLRVRYFPYKQPLVDILANAKTILLPFRDMGVRPPLTIVEAMAIGACVVTTPIGGTDELIRHGQNGYLVRPDADKIVEALRKLLKDKNRFTRIGKRARFDIRKLFPQVAYARAISLITRQST